MEILEAAQQMEKENKNYLKDGDNSFVFLRKDKLSSEVGKIVCMNTIDRRLINSCRNDSCPLCQESWERCLPNGNYLKENCTMIVDSFPDEFEALVGCFTGDKGDILNQALSNCKKSRADIYCTTMIKCTNLSSMNQDIVKRCLDNFFLKELQIVKPSKLILTSSAFNACVKYGIINIPDTQNISFFQKINTNYYDLNFDLVIIYDFPDLSKDKNTQTYESFIKGLQCVL